MLKDKIKRLNDKAYRVIVWVLRIAIGATFIIAGFTKCIDPGGFVIKIQEYLNVWGIDWLWPQFVVSLAVSLSVAEFCAGFTILTGCLRRISCWLILMIMAFMLPLTAYIAIASPVSDCGCFGDAIVISNTATFIKNILITLGAVYLLKYNKKVAPLYPPLMQWMPLVASVLYCLILAFVGLTIQPMWDFRPYKVGTPLIPDADDSISLIYERDGIKREFDLDQLPDSTWTYVGRKSPDIQTASLAIFDDGVDVTADVIDTEGAQILLVVPDVSKHAKTRSSMANNVNDYITSHGGTMIGLIGTDHKGLEKWRQVAKPNFETYTVDDTSLKSLVRGDAGLVYIYDDTIRWKRSIFALSGDFPDFKAAGNQLDEVFVIDSGRPLAYMTECYVAVLLILFLLGLIRIKKDKKKTENKDTSQ